MKIYYAISEEVEPGWVYGNLADPVIYPKLVVIHPNDFLKIKVELDAIELIPISRYRWQLEIVELVIREIQDDFIKSILEQAHKEWSKSEATPIPPKQIRHL